MDNKLRQVLEKHSPKFKEWIEKLNQHGQSRFSDREYSQEESMDLHMSAANVLGDISNLFFEYGAFKDKFDNGMMYSNLDGPSIIIKSEKLQHRFNFAIGDEGICLSSYLKCPENLRHMDDDFYKDIFTLQSLGKFEIEEREFYPKEITSKYQDFFTNRKSVVFRLLRNYFVGTIEDSGDIYLGDFRILWTPETDFPDLVSNACLAFKIIYRLNYSLWKISDLQTKKEKKIS